MHFEIKQHDVERVVQQWQDHYMQGCTAWANAMTAWGTLMSTPGTMLGLCGNTMKYWADKQHDHGRARDEHGAIIQPDSFGEQRASVG